MNSADTWKIAFEREREARQLVERQLDEKTREVQSSLNVMRFQHELMQVKNKELELLSTIASFVYQSMSVQECIAFFLKALSDLLPCVYAQAFVHEGEEEDIWCAFGEAEERIPMPPISKDALKNYRGALQPYHLEAIQSKNVVAKYVDPAESAYMETLAIGGVSIVTTVPLLSNENCVAVVEFGFLTDEIATSDVVGVVQTAAHQIGTAMERREQQNHLAENFRDLMKTHEDLKRVKNQLVQSEKMASLGQLSAGVAHEINNPVGFVLSNMGSLSDYLSTLVDLAQRAKKLCGAIDADNGSEMRELAAEYTRQWRASDVDFIIDDLAALMKDSEGGLVRVRDIVASLKDFARADHEQKHEPTQLEGLIEQSVRLVWNEIKYTAELKCDFEPVPSVTCNPRQISQVIVNLLVNAAQAMKQGVITIRLRQVDGFARIDIADTGEGIPPAILDHIFEPFFTTKPVGVGTGLGLSIAYGFLQAHGGRIEVESAVGAGTCFSLFLPLREQ